jgi:tRNA-2-methylthio-N6-dimethylallyladenosine synthase
MKKVYFDEAGCHRRRLDLGKIRAYLAANGYVPVARPDDADLVVAVTCAFKKKEEDESVARLRVLRRSGRPMLVYGCLADIAPARYGEFAGVPTLAPRELDGIDRFFADLAVPFAEVDEANVVGRGGGLVSLVRKKVQTGTLLGGASLGELAESGVRALKDLVRPRQEPWSLFVCRGCRGRCSYCAIRRSIGGVRSKPVADVVEEFRAGVRAGYREFSVLGDDPGCYGVDIGESFPRVIDALSEACEEPEVKRVINGERVFHVKEIHPKFAVAYEEELTRAPFFRRVRSVLCPVQSGNARVLDLMEREHAPADLLRTMLHARSANPEIALETQIIVGFPTETDDEFGDTLRAVRDAGFGSVVVFPYHDKEGAAAAEIAPKVPQETIKRRMREAFRYFRREGIKAYYSCP